MKITDAQKTTLANASLTGPVCLLEFRGETIETIKYNNKEGKADSFQAHRVAVETIGESCEQWTLEMKTDRGQEPRPLNYAKGTIMLVRLTRLVQERGKTTANASLVRPLDHPDSVVPLQVKP